jgi:ABC-type glutathione transport system ATPase component
MLTADISSISIFMEGELRTILKNIKLDIQPGKIYTILGKNGSGKSTLIKSLTVLLPTDRYRVIGNVLFEGNDLLNIDEEKLREIRKNNIRYVFQDAANSLDPLKRIKYYFDLSEKAITLIGEHLNYFQLPEYKKISHLHSYELSGGMNQRLMFVLAILATPNLIILDEPTSGVDYAVMNLILLKLKEFVKEKDKSVLIVTQDINFAIKLSDYVAYLSEGTLTRFFTPNELISSSDTNLKNFINSFKEISNVSA